MLFADSMSLLWLSYYGLSLLVLLAVYFALALFPRLPRLVITWCVAGAMWMPANYRLPLVEEGGVLYRLGALGDGGGRWFL